MTTEYLTKLGRVCVFVGVLSVSAPAPAANVSLTAGDAGGSSSFNSAGHWDNAAAPSAANDYFNANFLLRTPADANNYTFGGNSLTITSGSALAADLNASLLYKGTGTNNSSTITVNNLTINGGNLRQADNDDTTFVLAGNGLTVGASGMGVHLQGPTIINAPVLGSGEIRIVDNGSTDARRTLHFASAANTFNGNITLPTANRSRFTLDNLANMVFNIDGAGVNNSISGVGVATFNGVFQFDLSGASTTPGDSWTVVNNATVVETFGPTFSVSGFTQSGGFWTNGTYLFNPANGVLSVETLPNSWSVNGGGNWNVPGNWSGGVPAADSNVTFGSVLTAANAPATVNLDVPASLNRLTFDNANQYILGGANTLTLTGLAQVVVNSGAHEIGAVIAGTSGLTKTGTGEVILSANNTYSGLTDVQGGILRIRNVGAVDGNVNVATGAALFFQGNGAGGGFNGTFAGDIQGAGEIDLSATLTTETVTFSSAKTYTGQTVVHGGTLAISNSSALGAANADLASRTLITGTLETGKLALSGSIAVGTEVLALEGRQGAALNAVGLTSSGNNSWAGNIRGAQAGGNQYNIESTSGTLTLSGTVSAFDEVATRTFVFSGAGNTNITGQLTDEITDGGTGAIVGSGANDNLNVIKRGTGTLTISTASTSIASYWRGTTTIEAGTLEVISDGSDGGELPNSSTTVKSGATLKVDNFGTYELQPTQALAGAGTVNATGKTLGIFGGNRLTPGDSVGTLTVNGAVTWSDASSGGTLNYELGDTPGTVGGTENDLIQINGALTTSGSPSMTLNVTPVEAQLGSGSYRLINHSGGAAADVSAITPQVISNNGDVLNIRQGLSVTSAAGQVNLTVTGNEASRTWNGTSGNNTWDVDTSTNWVAGDQKFRDLDDVTFGSAAAEKNVTLDTHVAPGSVNFSGGVGSTYTVTGTGGITGYGAVNANSGTAKLNNAGNNYRGTTTIANGARLEMATASTGNIVANGTLAVKSTLSSTVVDNFGTVGLGEYTQTRVLDNAVAETNVTLSDSSGALVASYGGATSQPEQVLLLRDDTSLAVGQTLYVDVAMPTTTSEMDFGLAVSATKTPNSVADPTPIDTRNTFNWASVSVRPSQDAIRVNSSSGGTVTTATGTIGGVNETTVRQLYIQRTSSTDFTVGYVDTNSVRHDASVISIPAGDVGTAIGFYGDLRAVGGSLGSLDNLQVATGTASNTLSINGNFTLASTGTLELDIAKSGFSRLNVSGTASLDGTIAVDLLDGFTPTDGTQYTVLSAVGGITDLGFNLPTNFTAQIVGTTNLVLTFNAGLPGDFNSDGKVDAGDYITWRKNNGTNNALANDNGLGTPIGTAHYNLWRANYGNPPGSGSQLGGGSRSAVPEPATCVLTFVVGVWLLATRRFGAAQRRAPT